MKIIARIHTDFPTKFGIPRQSGIIEELQGTVVFEPEYRNADALRGLEKYSHIWLIWQFSENLNRGWKPTVRPPKLGGNARKGVFATRSPFRPNPIGLSSVRLKGIEYNSKSGPVLHISGADLMDNTPIYDIKPYLPLIDCHPEAAGGFTESIDYTPLQVNIPEKISSRLPQECSQALIKILEQDPRPAYQEDPDRIYGLPFRQYDIRFKVANGILTVCEIIKI
ncbi:MAG: tRNA (N6-threonylcarbamoyladenosine(37)-N6)-methyltransferase TrmO [Bacillota bacterium]|jgi:tRNA-Thr(GGU) m(6)t(6)A37 methyltransferase TsaA